MPIQTKEDAQDKVSNKVDRNWNRKKKEVSLSELSWGDLNQMGATLAQQEEWIKLKRKKLDREQTIRESNK
jgi:hypothetical protein